MKFCATKRVITEVYIQEYDQRKKDFFKETYLTARAKFLIPKHFINYFRNGL